MNKTILTFDNQLEFKKFARKTGGKFYFDDVNCVDEATSSNIDGVTCDGTLTFDKAAKMLTKYFANKKKAEAKAKKEATKAKAKAKKDAKRQAAKAKKEAAKAKRAEKQAKMKAKKQAAKEKAKAKAKAKKEKEALKKAKMKAKKEAAKEKAKTKKQIIKTSSKHNKKTNNGCAFKDVAKAMQTVLANIASDWPKLNPAQRDDVAKSIAKCGYSINETDSEVTVTFTASKSKKLRNKSKVKVEQPKENDKVEVTNQPNGNDEVEVLPASNIDAEKVAAEVDEIFNETFNDNEDVEDQRYDNEVDEDKVDFRRECFSNMNDEGEFVDDEF